MKKIIYFLFLLCFLKNSLNAQQISFQGKLFLNNTPVNGANTFQFFIDAPINWSETHTGVMVTNGIYSLNLGSINPLPLNLFETAQTRNMVIRVNGNTIDTVTLLAGFERDYTVPAYLKDGVSWTEVTNKPATIDISNTNEIQTLSINRDTLRISQGNYVLLPNTGSNNGNVVINGSLTVIDTAITSVVSQSGFTNVLSGVSVWQSFIPRNSGKLRQIIVDLGITGNSFVTLKIYNGEGNTSQAILTLPFNNLNQPMSTKILDVSSFSPSVELINGKQYTFEIVAPVGGTIDYRVNNTNPYLYGRNSVNATSDLAFNVMIDYSAPACFSVTDSCKVGIGISTPTAKLHVSGRIKDETGFVMPVGSIMAYGGTTAPEGWLLCDGALVNKYLYLDLFNAIGNNFGSGNGNADLFRLPDLRGRFLRGVDSTAGRDPDKATRTASNTGGNIGNNVGSVQGHQFKSHNHGGGVHSHTVPNNNNLTADGVDWSAGEWGGYTGSITTNVPTSASNAIINTEGGNETRPTNIYVNYIIKY